MAKKIHTDAPSAAAKNAGIREAGDELQPDSLELELVEQTNLVEHRERQIDAIRRISNALFSRLSVDEMVREILTVAIEVLRAEVGSLQLYDPRTDSLVFRYVLDPAAPSLTGHSIPATQGISGRVFRTGVPDLTHHATDRPEFNADVDKMTGFRTESMLTSPLKRFEGQPIGVIQILNSQKAFDKYDLEVLEVLCAHATMALETARITKQIRKAEIVNLIGDISHDIKNMLTPIKTGTWTMETTVTEFLEEIDKIGKTCPPGQPWGSALSVQVERARADCNWVISNALKAMTMLENRAKDIADAVKGEPAPPVFQHADLNDTIHDVVDALRLVAHKAGVALCLDLDSELPTIYFDIKQAYNAFYNLVINAIAATPSAGSVTIRTRHPLPGSDELLVEVEDTGRGMPEFVREKLFTDAAISTKPGGTGLGTRIVMGAVERHRGRIEVRSEIAQGTVISIYLPVKQDAVPTYDEAITNEINQPAYSHSHAS